jgi:hypothetical protein
MNVHGSTSGDRRRTRRDLLRQYVRLQRDLVDGDPSSSTYQATIHAFRQMGYALITAGFEDDLDRLLRIRVLEGGRAQGIARADRSCPPELFMIEQRRAE